MQTYVSRARDHLLVHEGAVLSESVGSDTEKTWNEPERIWDDSEEDLKSIRGVWVISDDPEVFEQVRRLVPFYFPGVKPSRGVVNGWSSKWKDAQAHKQQVRPYPLDHISSRAGRRYCIVVAHREVFMVSEHRAYIYNRTWNAPHRNMPAAAVELPNTVTQVSRYRAREHLGIKFRKLSGGMPTSSCLVYWKMTKLAVDPSFYRTPGCSVFSNRNRGCCQLSWGDFLGV